MIVYVCAFSLHTVAICYVCLMQYVGDPQRSFTRFAWIVYRYCTYEWANTKFSLSLFISLTHAHTQNISSHMSDIYTHTLTTGGLYYAKIFAFYRSARNTNLSQLFTLFLLSLALIHTLSVEHCICVIRIAIEANVRWISFIILFWLPSEAHSGN